MNAIDVLLSRASASRLAPPVPDGDTLRQILASASRAPDHGGLRPWRLLVIRGSDGLARLADAGVAALRRRNPDADAVAIATAREKLTRAPMVIALGGYIRDGGKIPPVEQVLAVGAAGMNILNALHALGFAAKWVTGPNVIDAAFIADLGFEAGDALFGLLMVGTAETRPEPPPRDDDRPVPVRFWGDADPGAPASR